MLACSGFCDDAPLAHAPRKQTLANAVVDFVRSGVQQIFTLEVNARSSQFLRQPGSVEKRSRTAGILPKQPLEFILKLLILLDGLVRSFEFFERRHQRLRNIASAIRTESSGSRDRAQSL